MLSLFIQQPPTAQSLLVDRELIFLLVGAGITLVTAVVTAIMQHSLNLRADGIRRERDRVDAENQRRREKEERFRQMSARGELRKMMGPELSKTVSEERLRDFAESLPDEWVEFLEQNATKETGPATQRDR